RFCGYFLNRSDWFASTASRKASLTSRAGDARRVHCEFGAAVCTAVCLRGHHAATGDRFDGGAETQSRTGYPAISGTTAKKSEPGPQQIVARLIASTDS